MVSLARNEHELLSEVANQYRSQGYQVFVEPRVEGLPDFLREFRPDLVARGKKENVVVEVKQWGDRVCAQFEGFGGRHSEASRLASKSLGYRTRFDGGGRTVEATHARGNPKRTEFGTSP